MLATLVVATALTRVTFVHCFPSDERGVNNNLVKRIFLEDDMTPEFTEQLGHHDHRSDIKKRIQKPEKYGPPRPKDSHRSKAKVKYISPISTESLPKVGPSHKVKGKNTRTKKRLSQPTEEVDVVDREDHVTQYLSDLLVNTDSEITSLQASETDDERDHFEVKEDTFFAFLTGQEKPLEVEGAWSKPAGDDLEHDDRSANVIVDIFVE